MRISELARASGVAVSTVRYYERDGILPDPGRDPNGYRAYRDEDVRVVRYLRRGQGLGFTLSELHALALVSERTRATGVLAAEVADQARDKIAEIDERIADLTRTRNAITGLLDAQCLDPQAECPIIEALAGGSAP
jgi:DNA-binding transcriptional MerR regulator